MSVSKPVRKSKNPFNRDYKPEHYPARLNVDCSDMHHLAPNPNNFEVLKGQTPSFDFLDYVVVFRPLSWLRGCKVYGAVSTTRDKVQDVLYARDLNVKQIESDGFSTWIPLFFEKEVHELNFDDLGVIRSYTRDVNMSSGAVVVGGLAE